MARVDNKMNEIPLPIEIMLWAGAVIFVLIAVGTLAFMVYVVIDWINLEVKMKRNVRDETLREAQSNQRRWLEAACDTKEDNDLKIHEMVRQADEYGKLAKLLKSLKVTDG